MDSWFAWLLFFLSPISTDFAIVLFILACIAGAIGYTIWEERQAEKKKKK